MEKVVLKADHRSVTGKKVGVLRRQGMLPGVLYGHNVKPTPIVMNLREATKILSGLTASSLITIALDGKEQAALVREKQKNYIRGELLHVDFQVVSLTEKIRAKVAIELTSEAPAVKDFNGIVVTGVNELEVESYPQDLPQRFIVDISNLAKIGDGVYVRDIPVSNKVEVLDSPDEMVVLITAATEEEEVPVEAAVEEPEVIEKGKKEEGEEESAE
ncbi:MAG TPA: 50S ribosomal protein L25 [Anaerolineaceae bacterium]|nr:50S ribosomal protein L25 [Anaerolineaceae bacterium]